MEFAEEEEGDRRENKVLAEDEAIPRDFLAQFDAISCSRYSVSGTKGKSRLRKKRVLPYGLDLSTHNITGPCHILY